MADLRYGEEDSTSPSTLIFAAKESKLRIKTLHIPGRHKVRKRTDGILRPKLFCEAKIDEIYDLIKIGHIGRIFSWPQTLVKQIMATEV